MPGEDVDMDAQDQQTQNQVPQVVEAQPGSPVVTMESRSESMVDDEQDSQQAQSAASSNPEEQTASADNNESVEAAKTVNQPQEPLFVETSGRSRRRVTGWDAPVPQAGAPGSMPAIVAWEQGQAQAQAAQAAMLLQQQLAAAAGPDPATRLARRIYVGSLPYEVTPEMLRMPFSTFGAIVNIDMPKEPGTNRSKGFCFIEYANPESARAAMQAMNGFPIGNRPIKVNFPNPTGAALSTTTTSSSSGSSSSSSGGAASGVMPAASPSVGLGLPGVMGMNPMMMPGADPASAMAAMAAMQQQQMLMMQSQSQQAQARPGAPKGNPQNRIYIGSVPYQLSSTDLRAIFEPFGAIVSCDLIPNLETGGHKGYGFIEFADHSAVKLAIEGMNGVEMFGRNLKVSYSHSSQQGQQQQNSQASQPAQAAGLQGLGMPGMPGAPNPVVAGLLAGMGFGTTGSATGAAANTSGVASSASSANSGLLDPQSLAAAIAQHTGGAGSDAASVAGISGVSAGVGAAGAGAAGAAWDFGTPSNCIVLANTVGPEDADDPELPGEVQQKCESFGPVSEVRVTVSREPVDYVVEAGEDAQHHAQDGGRRVLVFVKFTGVEAAGAALRELHRRFFGGRVVRARYCPVERFPTGGGAANNDDWN